jgi:two-component system, chemotaxis family, protein-glutamate methylesterase/glutaminase
VSARFGHGLRAREEVFLSSPGLPTHGAPTRSAPRRVRVLIVDDSVVVRRIVADALGSDPAIEVVGVAADGKIALAKVEQVNPDVIVLDLEMPVQDGFQTLATLRVSHPNLPVIIFSSSTRRGAAATFDALAMGAKDYVTKPERANGTPESLRHIRDELIPRIKQFTAPLPLPLPSLAPHDAKQVPARHVAPAGRVADLQIVVIGVSTGGPAALSTLFAALPADLAAPIVVVQHMPPVFTTQLAERISARSALEVREAKAGDVLRPGLALIAPGDYHVSLERDASGVHVETHQGPPENSCRPSADVLFRSAAASFGPAVLGVVMTGMGQDGCRGAQDIRVSGGQIVAQDEASSVVWGMPGYVVRAGLADAVVPLEGLATEIVRRVRPRAAAGFVGPLDPTASASRRIG